MIQPHEACVMAAEQCPRPVRRTTPGGVAEAWINTFTSMLVGEWFPITSEKDAQLLRKHVTAFNQKRLRYRMSIRRSVLGSYFAVKIESNN